MKHRELKIPVALSRHIISAGRSHQFRVWLACKAVHGGWTKKKDLDKQKVANLCGFGSTQTVDYHLNKLLEWNWIGQDEKHYFFRPIKFLCQKYNINKNSKGYVIDLKKELKEIRSVLFTMAVKAVTTWRHYAEANIGAFKQADANGYTIQSYKNNTLSVRLLADLLEITVNMVHRLKKSAAKLGYLDIKHNSRLVLPYEHSYLFEHHHEKLFTKDNALRVRLADEIKPFLPTK